MEDENKADAEIKIQMFRDTHSTYINFEGEGTEDELSVLLAYIAVGLINKGVSPELIKRAVIYGIDNREELNIDDAEEE